MGMLLTYESFELGQKTPQMSTRFCHWISISILRSGIAIAILSQFMISGNCLCQSTIVKAEIYQVSLQVKTTIATRMEVISDSTRLFLVCTHPEFLNQIAEFEKRLEGIKPIKGPALGHYRILVVLKHSDGTGSYLAGNTVHDLEYNSKVYKKMTYEFYNMLNRYIQLPTLEMFLKDNGLLAPNGPVARVCN